MFVSNYMGRPVVGVRPDTPLSRIRELMQQKKIRHLPVLDEGNRLLGMVSDRDLRSAFPASLMTEEEQKKYQERFSEMTAQEIMTGAVHTIAANATLDDALLLFDGNRVGAMPVVEEDGKVVGILSVRDLLSAYRGLFGLGEKGSRLLTVADDGRPKIFSRLTDVLENENIPFTRILRGSQKEEGCAGRCLYVRVHTFNSSHVRKALEEAGFKLV